MRLARRNCCTPQDRVGRPKEREKIGRILDNTTAVSAIHIVLITRRTLARCQVRNGPCCRHHRAALLGPRSLSLHLRAQQAKVRGIARGDEHGAAVARLGQAGCGPRSSRYETHEAETAWLGRTAMKALVYHGPGRKALRGSSEAGDQRADRRHRQNRQDDDLRHRSSHSQRRRADLRARAASSAMKASASSTKSAPASPRFKPATASSISCISSCGKCDYCRSGMYSHCTNGGWILGNKIDGTQAEFVRIAVRRYQPLSHPRRRG